MRQVGVVIGLTVILTFPVTVVSGAGSQKGSDHIVTTSPNQRPILAQADSPKHQGSRAARPAPLR